MIVYLAQDIPPFVTYCVYGKSGSSLLIESTDSMTEVHNIPIQLYSIPPYSLHYATEVHNIAILHFNFKIKGATDASTARHACKVDGRYRLKLDVDRRLMHEYEALVQRVEVARGGSVGTCYSTLVTITEGGRGGRGGEGRGGEGRGGEGRRRKGMGGNREEVEGR